MCITRRRPYVAGQSSSLRFGMPILREGTQLEDMALEWCPSRLGSRLLQFNVGVQSHRASGRVWRLSSWEFSRS